MLQYECLTSPRRILVSEGGILKLRPDVQVRIVRKEAPGPAVALQDRVNAIRDRMQQRMQTKQGWTKEEEALRGWVWRDGLVQPHESLNNAIDQLSESDRKLYDWTVKAWTQVNSGSGVGLDVRSPQEKMAAQSAEPGPMPDAPTSGAKTKQALLGRRLRLEQGRRSPLCKQVTKAILAYKHQQEQILQSARAPLFLEHYLPHTELTGSLPDRLLALASAALLAVASKRAFLVDWQAPMPIDLLFDSAIGIDWSYPFVPDAEKAHPIFGDESTTIQRKEVGSPGLTKAEIDAALPEVEWTDYDIKWLRLLLDRDAVFRTFDYSSIGSALLTLGFKQETALHCAVSSFLAPKSATLAFASRYAALLLNPSVFSVGIQIRTRGPDEPFPPPESAVSASAYRGFFKCAAQMAQKHAVAAQKIVYYLVSDSDTVNAVALEEFKDNVLLSSFEAMAVDSSMDDVKPFEHDKQKHTMNAAMDQVAELWTLASSDFQVVTKGSAFGKLAAMLTGIEGRTVALAAGTAEENVDCSVDNAFTSFETMSMQW
ncbi:hypothetical protein OIV83_001393 [Microbotryomycetes sp. JL201]|nr:hypothetical protein OIV83_001393 [Microbotryomycetes sp. JL201]